MKSDQNTQKDIEYNCIICGIDLIGKVRIQNDKLGYVKCLKHGLGVDIKPKEPIK